MTTFLSIIVILFLSQLSTSFGILVCENGLYCASDEDCPIGNHCIDFLNGKKNSTQCVPRDDLDGTYFCSLSKKSCESLPCCSGICDDKKTCRPLLPPHCIFPTGTFDVRVQDQLSKGKTTQAVALSSTRSSPSKPPTAVSTKLPSKKPSALSTAIPTRLVTKTPSKLPSSKSSFYPTAQSTRKTPTTFSPTIVYSTCSNCCGQSAITTPITMTSIPDYAFDGCTSFVSVLIPTFVTSIGFQAFSLCTSLTSISIPTSVNIISDAAFYSCTSLSSISIPTSVTYIGSYAFAGCTSLTCRRISDTTTVDSTAFYGDPANSC
mmetsp:Transcript_9228/g.12747  ORF Transcript_9228/g.12747 Transcript_9228/m.12747 type:complete len:320 (+) Transcript_9228:45-1004(+)